MRRLTALLLGMFLAVCSMAQVTMPDTYRLQPEDLLRIQVYAQGTDFELLVDVPVGQDGNITVPFVGVMPATGLTTDELANNIRARFQQEFRLRDPKIGVALLSARQRKAGVTGAVNRPGTFVMRPGATVLDLLADAGGFIPDRADLRRATLRRKGSDEIIPLDLYALMVQMDTSQNYPIMDGDTLNVPANVRNRIFVLGAIRAPGEYAFREQMTVLDAFVTSGGPIDRVTKASDIKIFRRDLSAPGGTRTLKVDLVRFLERNDYIQNIELEPGDVIYVGKTQNLDPALVRQIADALFILDRVGIRLFSF